MKKSVFLIFFCVTFFINNFAQNSDDDTITKSNSYSSLSDSIIAFGKNYLNVRYRSGGMSEKGFDCSGFTSFVYKNFGYKLARTSAGQAQQFDKVKKGDWKCGDLVFFNGRKRGKRIGHVGIIAKVQPDGSFDFIHASVKGVRITNSEQNYYKLRYMGAGRVINDANQLSQREQPNLSIEEADTFDTQISPQDIKNYNEQDEIELREGQKLTIGGNTTAAKEIVNVQEFMNTNDEKDEKLLHIVHQGDTLYSISKIYGCSIEQIKQWNNKYDNELKIGDEIVILN